jgi:spore coat protein CotH
VKIAALAIALCAWLPAAAAADPATALSLPFYSLQLTDKAMAELIAHRERIRELDFLTAADRHWVPATFVHDGERYPARLRLRGDLPVHWRGERHSYRIKFKERLFAGRKEINLIVPWDKHYAVEWLQVRIGAELGLLVLPGRFVDLAINGRRIGLYYESEHPTREYLEREGRMPSSIFTFGANWTYYFGQEFHYIAFERSGSETSPPVESIGQIKQRRTYDADDSELARRQMGYMLAFYELLTEGSDAEVGRQAGLYLDLGKFARYVALQDLFGSTHSMALNDNSRLYLDPSSGKFEFIPWDIALWSLAERARKRNQPVAALLEPENPVFRRLLASVPGLRAERDEVLRSLIARGDGYRRTLADHHAALVRLYPEDERLAEQSARHDVVLADNIRLLAEALADAPQSGAP